MFHIIDDEPILLELLETMTIEAGYSVLCFESGDKYLKYFNSPEFKKPIAILSDVTMPGIDGYQLTLEIREVLPFQKVVLVTGNADDEHHRRAGDQLCYTLGKPYSPDKLVYLIHSLAACEAAHTTGDLDAYPQQCEFGIDHHCPFHKPS